MDKYKLAKNACYLTGATMAISANLSPLLFLSSCNFLITYQVPTFLSILVTNALAPTIIRNSRVAIAEA